MKTNVKVWKEDGKECSDIRVAWDWIFDAIFKRTSKN